jgi:hypothetical protein
VSYASPVAFRAALEARLSAAARAGGPPAGRARKVVAFTRLLARLRRAAPDGWVLKGGFALELRLAGRARTTRDVDLDFAAGLEAATEALVAAAATDLDDFFEFAVERVGAADVGAPGGGVRFRAEARVAGRAFETLAIDVGVGPTGLPSGDELQVPDLLGFAGISSPRVPAAPLERHLAEKLHALTRRYGADQPSSRPKDLIDILLISELAVFDAAALRAAVARVFAERATHAVPTTLPAIPVGWARPYAVMASEVDLDADPAQGRAEAQAFLAPLWSADDQAQHWDPVSRSWR